MRQILSTLIAAMVAFTAMSQTSPPNKVRSNDSFTQVDNYLVAAKRLGIPSGPTPTLNSTTSSENSTKLFYNTTTNMLMVYDVGDEEWTNVSPDVDLSNYYTKPEVDALLAMKADLDDLANYYTQSQIDGFLAQKADVTDLDNFYTQSETDDLLADKADVSDLDNYIPITEKGAAGGVASLDVNSKVPLSQIPDALVGSVNYQGNYNVTTNTPTLPTSPGTGTKGHYYVVSVGGTRFGETFVSGDWIISNGSEWQKVDNNNAVTSVNGKVGSVNLTATDVGALQPGDDVSELNNDAGYITSGDIPGAQTLTYNHPGTMSISDGNSVNLGSIGNYGAVTSLTDFLNNEAGGLGFYKIHNTTGSSGFPGITGNAIIARRLGGTTSGTFGFWTSAAPGGPVYLGYGINDNDFVWGEIATQPYVRDNFITTNTNQTDLTDITGNKVWNNNNSFVNSITFDPMSSGGYARGLTFKATGDGKRVGGIGAYGTTDTLNYMYLTALPGDVSLYQRPMLKYNDVGVVIGQKNTINPSWPGLYLAPDNTLNISANSNGIIYSSGEPVLTTNNTTGFSILSSPSDGGIVYIYPNGRDNTAGRSIFGPTTTTIGSLTGTGTQMVVANATGVLSRQAIPTFTTPDLQDVTDEGSSTTNNISTSGSVSASNVITSALSADGNVGFSGGNVSWNGVPSDPDHLTTKEYVDAQSVIEALDEGNGIGYRIRNEDPSNHGNIGLSAVDLSTQTVPSGFAGATGSYSFATGVQTMSSGSASFATGNGSEATGSYSASFGQLNVSSGQSSVSFGSSNEASGPSSVAFGIGNEANVSGAVIAGTYNIANSWDSFTLGRFNDPILATPATGQASTDPVFIIGSGSGTTSRANSFVIFRDGRSEQNKDIEVKNIGQGVVIKSPDGTRWRITVDNSGNLTTTQL